MRKAPVETPPRSFKIDIPPAEAVALIVLLLETVDESWRKKRLDWGARVYRTRRNVELAMEYDGGLRTLFLNSLPKRRSASKPSRR